jgi:predicted RNase H-like HicB family nuclease
MFKYSIILDWSNEDDCYLATIKEFPGLSAFGDTPEQAAHEAQIAAEAMIEVMKEDGDEIPVPALAKRPHNVPEASLQRAV